MGSTFERSELHQSVAKSLIESGAIDLGKMTDVYRDHAERALLDGDDLVLVINKRVIINCGWPGPLLREVEQVEGRLG